MSSRRTTNILLGIILVLIIAVGIYYFLIPSKTAVPENSGQNVSSTTPSSVNYTIRNTKESNAEKFYTIQTSYPVFSLNDGAVEKKINTNVANLIGQEIDSYKSSFNDGSVSPGAPSAYGTSTFQIDFNIVTNTRLKTILPLRFDENFYSAGAAHPGETIITKNYDLRTGLEITLASIFKPGAAYLEALSDYSIKTLEQKLGPDANADDIRTGAGPSNENFDHFLITDKGLLIIFNEYQVAAYAAGAQEITIPYNVLQDILNPNLNLL